MDDKIIGIEVAGLTYGLKDEETANTADQAKAKANTAAEAAEAASSAVTEQAQKVAEIESNIGGTNIQELSATVESHSEELAEVAKELPKINMTLSEILLSRLVLLKEGENDSYIKGENSDETVDFAIDNWDKYRGVILVHNLYRAGYGMNQDIAESIREAKTFLKKADGSLRAHIYGCTRGERMVNDEHIFTVSTTGQAALYAGYAPKGDSDSESDDNQNIIGIHQIYGILKE